MAPVPLIHQVQHHASAHRLKPDEAVGGLLARRLPGQPAAVQPVLTGLGVRGLPRD